MMMVPGARGAPIRERKVSSSERCFIYLGTLLLLEVKIGCESCMWCNCTVSSTTASGVVGHLIKKTAKLMTLDYINSVV